MPPEASSHRRALDPLCPSQNATTYSANGYSWAILCGFDYPGNDLPSQPAASLIDCINACNSYQRNIDQLNGASCVAVSYNSANVNGNPCYLKSKIDQVTTNQNRIYVARRVQYNVGDAPIYSSITPSAAATSTGQSQASTSPPVLASSATRPSSSTGGASSLGSPSVQYSTLISIKTVVTGVGNTQSSSASSGPFGATQSSDAIQTDANSASPSSSSAAAAATSLSPSSPSTSSSTQQSSGLTDGAKIGIGVGIGVAGALAVAIILAIVCRRRRKRRTNEQRQPNTSSPAPAELEQTSKSQQQQQQQHKPVVLSGLHDQHPSSEKPHNPSSIQELSSTTPAGAELESPHYELSGSGGGRSVVSPTSPASPASPASRTSGSATLGTSTTGTVLGTTNASELESVSPPSTTAGAAHG